MAVILLAAVPTMLVCLVIAIVMRGWVWSTLRGASSRPGAGRSYAALNPDGFVIFFDVKLLTALSGPASSVLSDRERFWLRFYVASRLVGVVATLLGGFARLSIG
jgi:hypothetical protein